MLDLGFLDGRLSVFDFGCGRGDDLRLLTEMGIPAVGWDPVFRPDEEHRAADVVNLGFVLNVIENVGERRETLKVAFSLSRKVLVVSVMLGYRAHLAKFATHQDGVRTQRDTFQKYYTQDEFRTYIEDALDTNAIPVAPGICLVFRNHVDEQLFLLARQQVRRQWRLMRREPNSEATAAIVEKHRAQIDAYWRMALELGRPPTEEECPAAISLARLVGSWRRTHEWVARFFSSEELEAAAIARQEDLLVYFALAHFGRRRAYTELPSRLQRDVHFFFGNITKVKAAGKRALYAVADNERLLEAATFCHNELGIGKLEGSHHLSFHQSLLVECLPLVRIYVGCALTLFGDTGAVDLIKVHLQSSKVTFLIYDDLENGTPPKLVERIKVDLARLRVDFFDYTVQFSPEPLGGDVSEYYQR